MNSPDGDMTAARIELYLKPSGADDNDLERVEAYENVTLRDQNRTTTGRAPHLHHGGPAVCRHRRAGESGRRMPPRDDRQHADLPQVGRNRHRRRQRTDTHADEGERAVSLTFDERDRSRKAYHEVTATDRGHSETVLVSVASLSSVSPVVVLRSLDAHPSHPRSHQVLQRPHSGAGHQPRGRLGRGRRAARPERGREDDHVLHGRGPHRARLGPRGARWPRRHRRSDVQCGPARASAICRRSRRSSAG